MDTHQTDDHKSEVEVSVLVTRIAMIVAVTAVIIVLILF